VPPHDLLQVASRLAQSSLGKPKQAHLKRAISTAYYAMFHTLSAADMVKNQREQPKAMAPDATADSAAAQDSL
jgi:uncharacterized protein (UPF0332 family)